VSPQRRLADDAVPPSSSPAPAALRAAVAPAPGARADELPRIGRHIPALDGLRGLAIIGVLLDHFTTVTPEPTADWPRLLWRGFKSGWIGVDLFFVLSGFLITGILLDAKGGARYFRNFYMRRTLRIFPLYYAVLVVVFLVLPRFHLSARDAALLEEHGQWWYWLYLTNVLAAIHHFAAIPLEAGHLWSLAVEEQFYLFWPLVVFACSSARLRVVCLAILVTALLLRVGIRLADDPGYAVYPDAVYSLLITRADTLAMGGLLALAMRDRDGIARLRRLAPRVLLAAAIPIAVLFVRERGLNAGGIAMQTIGYSSLAVLFGSALTLSVLAPRESPLSRGLTAGWLMAFGRYSYAIYLFHGFVNPPLWRALGPHLLSPTGGMSWLARAAYILIGVGVTFVLAVLSWNLFERHFLKLKDLFPYERRERATLLPAP
jgi:peptidoglycan/LPS O-acetylase OafA/YrhL